MIQKVLGHGIRENTKGTFLRFINKKLYMSKKVLLKYLAKGLDYDLDSKW